MISISALFKAHMFFALVNKPNKTIYCNIRLDSSYTQLLARYVKLITNSAVERELPTEYLIYLRDIRLYIIITKK
jgi:hypothetical protein